MYPFRLTYSCASRNSNRGGGTRTVPERDTSHLPLRFGTGPFIRAAASPGQPAFAGCGYYKGSCLVSILTPALDFPALVLYLWVSDENRYPDH